MGGIGHLGVIRWWFCTEWEIIFEYLFFDKI